MIYIHTSFDGWIPLLSLSWFLSVFFSSFTPRPLISSPPEKTEKKKQQNDDVQTFFTNDRQIKIQIPARLAVPCKCSIADAVLIFFFLSFSSSPP
ncbi:hypothetical protein F4778DRAFT_721290 [Xylariomycetidae sp. FL2044]|nr:hypothetical protein F4778DRAFT_721290 [Xylariomycetidae sp. FL2044]